MGVVDADIASARSVIEWGGELQGTVDYVIVHVIIFRRVSRPPGRILSWSWT